MRSTKRKRRPQRTLMALRPLARQWAQNTVTETTTCKTPPPTTVPRAADKCLMTAPSQDRCPTRLPASTGGRWGSPDTSGQCHAIRHCSQQPGSNIPPPPASRRQQPSRRVCCRRLRRPRAYGPPGQARRSESPAHPPGSLRLGRWYACGAHVWPLPRGWGTAKAAETTRQRPKPAASSPRRRSARTCPQRACPKDAELPPSGARQCS